MWHTCDHDFQCPLWKGWEAVPEFFGSRNDPPGDVNDIRTIQWDARKMALAQMGAVAPKDPNAEQEEVKMCELWGVEKECSTEKVLR